MQVDSSKQQQDSVTVVVPCYRKQDVVIQAILRLSNCLEAHGLDFKIRVVIDGPDYQTSKALRELIEPAVEIIELPAHLGKGGAIICGSKQLKSDYVAFIDADLDLDPDGIASGIATLKSLPTQVVVAYGSKRHPQSKVEYPRLRRLASSCYRFYVKLLLGLDVEDTQVGLKVFRTVPYQRAIEFCVMNGFAFDVELLTLLKKMNFQSIPIPISLNYQFNSTVTPGSIYLGLRDVYRIRKSFKIRDNRTPSYNCD